jgi:hypothetical protein
MEVKSSTVEGKVVSNKKRKRASSEFIDEIEKSIKNSEEKAGIAGEPKSKRDFLSDLSSYLESWKNHIINPTSSTWKFNKILQEWALQHCLEEEKIPNKLFRLLLEYILTVKGASKSRLIDRMNDFIDLQEGSNESSNVGDSKKVLRAKRIVQALNKIE